MRLIPRNDQFYDMFNGLAHRMSISAKLLDQLFTEPGRLEYFVAEIKKVEHEADILAHDVNLSIDKSFVTPFDREDIHLLAMRLDDVIDLLDGTARRVAMFHITDSREPARRLCGVLTRAADCIEQAVAAMKKEPKVVSARAREMKKLEEEGDAIYHEAVGDLFKGNPDPLDVIKWKELYDTLERAIDQCQGVANTLESIAIKNG